MPEVPLEVHCWMTECLKILKVGYDPAESTTTEDEETNITIPSTDLPLSETSLSTLQASVDPLRECADDGIQSYRTSVNLVFHALCYELQLPCNTRFGHHKFRAAETTAQTRA